MVGYGEQDVGTQSFPFKTSHFIKAEEPNLLYHLPIASGRIDGFIPFPRAFMQTFFSRICTWIANTISYITQSAPPMCVCVYICIYKTSNED